MPWFLAINAEGPHRERTLLRRTFKVKKGHRVLVHAGAGGVGQLLCQWASALVVAKVIATVGAWKVPKSPFMRGQGM